MLWLCGAEGMLGTDFAKVYAKYYPLFLVSDANVDISNYAQIRDFVKDRDVDWIVNCAAYTNVEAAESDPRSAFKANSMGPQNLARLARSIRAKLVHISTDYVYAGDYSGAHTETMPTHPKTAYGMSKLQGELNIRDNWDQHFILRSSWLYGKHGKNFVNTILDKKDSEVRVVNDQFGSPTYTMDLSLAIMEIIKSNSTQYGTYNISNRGLTSWCNFANYIYNYKHIHKKVVPIPSSQYNTLATRPINSYLDTNKFETTFNLRLRNWQHAVEDYLA